MRHGKAFVTGFASHRGARSLLNVLPLGESAAPTRRGVRAGPWKYFQTRQSVRPNKIRGAAESGPSSENGRPADRTNRRRHRWSPKSEAKRTRGHRIFSPTPRIIGRPKRISAFARSSRPRLGRGPTIDTFVASRRRNRLRDRAESVKQSRANSRRYRHDSRSRPTADSPI